jgi:hypothetical protein
VTDREDAPHILENCSAIVHANNPVYFIRRQYHKAFSNNKEQVQDQDQEQEQEREECDYLKQHF